MLKRLVLISAITVYLLNNDPRQGLVVHMIVRNNFHEALLTLHPSALRL